MPSGCKQFAVVGKKLGRHPGSGRRPGQDRSAAEPEMTAWLATKVRCSTAPTSIRKSRFTPFAPPKAHDDTKADELKKLIESAKPVIQKHLDKAEDIQKKIGKVAS